MVDDRLKTLIEDLDRQALHKLGPNDYLPIAVRRKLVRTLSAAALEAVALEYGGRELDSAAETLLRTLAATLRAYE